MERKRNEHQFGANEAVGPPREIQTDDGSEVVLRIRSATGTNCPHLADRLDQIEESLAQLVEGVASLKGLPKKLNTRELAEFYEVSEKTILRWIGEKVVAPHRGRARSRYWLLNDVLRWDAENRDR